MSIDEAVLDAKTVADPAIKMGGPPFTWKGAHWNQWREIVIDGLSVTVILLLYGKTYTAGVECGAVRIKAKGLDVVSALELVREEAESARWHMGVAATNFVLKERGWM